MSDEQQLNELLAESQSRAGLFDRMLPDDYREEMRRELADPPPEPPAKSGSMVLFELGGQRLALPTRIASAVAPVLHIARIPHRSGTVLLGLAAFRGDILPCCSLARLLDLSAASSASSESLHPRTLILAEAPGRQWAAPVDAVLGVRADANEVDANHAPPPIAAQWIQAIYSDNIGPFYLLNHDILFRQITLATA